jgi:hypothetical protein
MTDRAETPWWSRAALIVLRLALGLFLLWALVSARFTADTTVATDAPGASSATRKPSAGIPADPG